jgi:membrane-bound inhibitor of C-type lysozyme
VQTSAQNRPIKSPCAGVCTKPTDQVALLTSLGRRSLLGKADTPPHAAFDWTQERFAEKHTDSDCSRDVAEELNAMMKMAIKRIAICFALVLSANPTWATEAVYRCADGTSAKAVFEAPRPEGLVRLTFAGRPRPVVLPQVSSADGGRYARGSMEFWIKGNTARLTRRGASTECETR